MPMLITPALPALYHYGQTPVARPERFRAVAALRHVEADPQERGRSFYTDRASEARAARPGKGRLVDISA